MRAKFEAVMLAMAFGAFGQTPATPPAFEVASIKAAAPPVNGRMMIRMAGDPGRVDYANVSLRDVIRIAYGVKEYQVSGPDWISATRFDILAKLPEGAPREEVPQMLQTLLAERFKLTVHRETKEHSMYALVVGKNGPKLKPAEADPQPLHNGGPPKPGYGEGGRMAMPRDGMPVMGGRGPMMMFNGRGHIGAKAMSMQGLAEMLARQLDRPVVDQTELKGTYDFTLDYTPEEGQGMRLPGLPPPPPPAPGGEARDGGTPESSSGLSLFAALQAQLGLKLEATKGPVDLVVVDHVEKTPTEN